MKNIFKLSNKIMITALLSALLAGLGSAQLKEQTFFNADKSKSFKGTLKAFDEENQSVRVRTSTGKYIRFKLSLLSEEGQTYVKENASKVAAASSLDISFEKVEEKKQKGVDGVTTTFDVTFYNRSKSTLKDLVIDYTVYYTKDSLNKGKRTSTKLTSTGSFDFYELSPKYRTTETTDAIKIVNKTIKGIGGG